MPTDAPIRILAADDHPMIRAGLVSFLATEPGLEVVGEAVDVVAGPWVAAGLSARRARFNLRVALCEALANAMIYGNRLDPAKTVEIQVTVTDPQLRIEVADEGGGFNQAHFDDVSLPDDLEATGGRGLFLIRQLVDDVYLNERGNTICMVLRRA